MLTKHGQPRQLFDQRAREADKRFSEAGYLGRRTDRGALFVLHGEPDSIEFEINPLPEQPPIEVWKYGAPHEVALNGRVPVPAYRFVKTGDITTIYRRPAELGRVRNPRRPFP